MTSILGQHIRQFQSRNRDFLVCYKNKHGIFLQNSRKNTANNKLHKYVGMRNCNLFIEGKMDEKVYRPF